MKGTVSTQPFIGDDSQCILVTSWARLALELALEPCRLLSQSPLGCSGKCEPGATESNTKVTEQDFVLFSYEHILRLDVAVNHLLIMRML